MTSPRNPWLLAPRKGSRPRLRLFCFPHAGGSATPYMNWASELPPAIEVCPVLLPGRDRRLHDPLMTNLLELAVAAAEGIRPALDVPFVMLGHSMGAQVAFEVTRTLAARYGLTPELLYVSACRAPHLPDRDKPIGQLPQEEFIQELKAMGGTPHEIFEHQELLEIVLPMLRADCTAFESYQYRSGPPLECPLTVLGGTQDNTVSEAELRGWQEHSRGPFRFRRFPGEHFYLYTSRAPVLRLLAQDFDALLAGGHGHP